MTCSILFCEFVTACTGMTSNRSSSAAGCFSVSVKRESNVISLCKEGIWLRVRLRTRSTNKANSRGNTEAESAQIRRTGRQHECIIAFVICFSHQHRYIACVCVLCWCLCDAADLFFLISKMKKGPCVACNFDVDAGKMFENATNRPLTSVVRAVRCCLMPTKSAWTTVSKVS